MEPNRSTFQYIRSFVIGLFREIHNSLPDISPYPETKPRPGLRLFIHGVTVYIEPPSSNKRNAPKQKAPTNSK